MGTKDGPTQDSQARDAGRRGLPRSRVRHGHRSGGRRSPTYNSWRAMQERCGRPQHPFYAIYGGRGIVVCERWASFVAFLEDMGERPPGCTLDREDVDGNYEPGNCRWSDAKTQRWNRRDMRHAAAQSPLQAAVAVGGDTDWAF